MKGCVESIEACDDKLQTVMPIAGSLTTLYLVVLDGVLSVMCDMFVVYWLGSWW